MKVKTSTFIKGLFAWWMETKLESQTEREEEEEEELFERNLSHSQLLWRCFHVGLTSVWPLVLQFNTVCVVWMWLNFTDCFFFFSSQTVCQEYLLIIILIDICADHFHPVIMRLKVQKKKNPSSHFSTNWRVHSNRNWGFSCSLKLE